ncbi:MAG: HAD family hydrolase [Cyclobacteriaceae bacterium]
MMKSKCVFLDRDGVLNEDRPDYAYQLDHFKILKGVPEALQQLKDAGYLLIVVTNQSGIAQGIYTQQEMEKCHNYLQEQCGGVIDYFYFSPYHPKVSESLGRKPGTLLFEKGIAKFNIDPQLSWMVGDRGRDLIPAKQLGMKTILIGNTTCGEEDFIEADLTAATRRIVT